MYLTKVLDDNNKDDRAAGLAAGISLLYKCDVVIYGDKYGISEGMYGEMKEARLNGIPQVNAESCTSVDDFIDAIQRTARGEVMQYRTCPACGANLDHGERCTCGGIETAVLRTPREQIIDELAAIEKAHQ